MTETDLKLLLLKIDGLFLTRRLGLSNGDWIVHGVYLNETTDEDIRTQLKDESVSVDIHHQDGEVVIRFHEEEDQVVLTIPKIPRINMVLFLATVGTTLFFGSLNAGGNPFIHPQDILRGIPFSVALMLILGCHEFGHYYYARRHHVDATLPYFIPAPTLIGTFGAFIKIKSPIQDRDALLQIGAAGPIAGFIVAVPALIIGLFMSQVIDVSGNFAGFYLGDSLLMKLLTWLIYPGLLDNQDIVLHPIAFAGWIGLLVTMLNLLPIGQLDGGHIAYAILGKKHDRLAKYAFFALIPLSLFSLNWLIWAGLILVLMRTTKHPPIRNIDRPLSRNDIRIGYICLAIFILCFIPAPFPN